jgi:hypothetical protein
MKWFRSRAVRLTVAAVAISLLAGCGGPGTVTGKATLDGQPMPGGLVTFHDPGDHTSSGVIQSDGTYTVYNINPGSCTVTVLTANMTGGISDLKPGEPYGKYVPIPPLYSQVDKAPFKLEVKTGKQEFNLDLKSEKKE